MRGFQEGSRSMPDAAIAIPFDAYTGEDPFAFVSYAHKDAPIVFPQILQLHKKGYRLWYDEGIDPGNEWPDEVARALAHCSLFIVFVSGAALASRNVRNEINFALNRGTRFLAIHLEPCELPPGLELRMGDLQAILKWRMDEAHYWRKLLKALPDSLAAGTRAPAKPPGCFVHRITAGDRVAEEEALLVEMSVTAEFGRRGVFRMVERNALQGLLAEAALMSPLRAQGLTEPSGGRIIEADYVVTGHCSRDESGRFALQTFLSGKDEGTIAGATTRSATCVGSPDYEALALANVDELLRGFRPRNP